jgi:hypothetical protein
LERRRKQYASATNFAIGRTAHRGYLRLSNVTLQLLSISAAAKSFANAQPAHRSRRKPFSAIGIAKTLESHNAFLARSSLLEHD